MRGAYVCMYVARLMVVHACVCLGQTSNARIYTVDIEWRTVQSKPLLTLHRRYCLVRNLLFSTYIYIIL